jgi:hypothetical protein
VNTLKFTKVEMGISIADKLAWVIARIEYMIEHFDDVYFNTKADNLKVGLAVSQSFTAAQCYVNNELIVDMMKFERDDYGTAASGHLNIQPVIHDFSTLPGGGIIVPPSPLYLFAVGTGLAAITSNMIRIYYTLRELAADEYIELVESRRVLT